MNVYAYTRYKDTLLDLASRKKYRVKDIFPLKKCRFVGLDVKCPSSPLSYFHLWYGDDFRPVTKCWQGRWVTGVRVGRDRHMGYGFGAVVFVMLTGVCLYSKKKKKGEKY